MKGVINNMILCILVYFWGLMEFSFLWIVVFTVGYIFHDRHRKEREVERENAILLQEMGEEEFLKVT